MKKKLIGASLSLFLLAPLSVHGAASYETEVERGVNFRSAPSTGSYVYRMIPSGEDIHVIEKVNSYWLKVEVQDGTVGYISANSQYTDYGSGGGSASATYETNIEWGVNFRSAPSSGSYVYRMIPKGENVHVIEKVNDYWLKIQAQDGTVGYISANSKYSDYRGGGSSASSGSGQASASTTADRIIDLSKSLMGKVTYDFGTRNPSRMIFDCSSFTEYVFEQNGVELKWGTRYQQNAGTAVSKANLRKGDLVFFTTTSSRTVNHVGIYIGDGKFIHNTPSVDGITISSLNSGYWADHYLKARRVL